MSTYEKSLRQSHNYEPVIVSKSLNNQMQLPRPFLRLLKQRNIKPLYFCRDKSFDTHTCLVAVMSVQSLFIFFVHILPYIFAIKRVLRVIQHMLLLSLNLDCGQQFNQQITIIFNNAPAIYYLTIYMSQVRLLTECKDQFQSNSKGLIKVFICTKNEQTCFWISALASKKRSNQKNKGP